MKFLLSIALTAIASLLLQIVLPWWSLALAAFLIGIIVSQSLFFSFLSGLLGTALVWWVYAWFIDMNTASLLSEKIAAMLQIGSPTALILLGGVLAGIVGGFAAASGSAFKKLFS
ncbi:MAG: hypothetical protein SH857_05510 [Chitinophagales bacterium]|nr:hypothetical protein [Chitinophagales bacterium]